MRYLLSFLIIFAGYFHFQAQDLFSAESTRKFADYLFRKGDYSFASEEYVRLLFLQPTDDTVVLKLSQTYRKLSHYDQAYQLFETRFSKPKPEWLEKEYLAVLLFQGNEKIFQDQISRLQVLSEETIYRARIDFEMRQRDWQSAISLLSAENNYEWKSSYTPVLQDVSAFRKKSPWLAGTMSAVIPGTGKIYARNAKEGITAFLFVAALGYQSYRAFHKRGSESLTGWIYGGLAAGFYFGNIYGSQQSAKNYNRRSLNKIYEKTDAIIFNHY